ncbi:hypothetical protein [Trichormus variabilis]|uniref:Uncharacterized protein n=1 Tax=Trichormus variabilis SAG 1403-4b TaxID=447716 RepID=A0A3S1IFR7_ANAVA|nr:hypothetical protein [Trichormus variabilis]MBD2628017.1 hypothetical protein [Trichormus variabilis FACHB-164]RUS96738.1 hypothetical protein DSM107003_21440 [Trichormus variabilis SAG 1403-4b]
MADISFTDKSKIVEIINTSSRLKYLIVFTYQIPLEDIVSVRVDGYNFKIDVNTETEMFRFKAKGVDSVIMKNIELGILQLTFDPALAQGIYNIVDEYL